MNEWAGFLTEGYPVSKNGKRWSLPKAFEGQLTVSARAFRAQPEPFDCRGMVAVGDVIDYQSGHSYRVTYVDVDLVKMEGPF